MSKQPDRDEWKRKAEAWRDEAWQRMNEAQAARAALAAARCALDAYMAAEWGSPEWDAAWDDLCHALDGTS